MGQQLCSNQDQYSKSFTQQMLNRSEITYQDDCDNPFIHKLEKQFLNTQIIASWNILEQKGFTIEYLQKIFSFAQDNSKSVKNEEITQNLRASFQKIDNNLIDAMNFALNDRIYRQKIKPQYQHVDIQIGSFIKIKTDNIDDFYEFHQKIGEGTYGNVYKAVDKKTKQLRAIKALKKSKMNNHSKLTFIAQIDLLKTLDHPNIVKLYDLFLYNQIYYVITQFCQGGSLQQYYHKRKDQITEDVSKIIMKQILSVLLYLNSQSIVHRDLKLDNIVFLRKQGGQKDGMNRAYEIKIIDFGTAIKVKNYIKNSSGLVGTLSYIAPEFIRGFYTEKCDVWSAGVIFYQMLFKSQPFKGKTEKQILSAISSKSIEWNKLQQKVSTQALQMIKSMLDKNYLTRPNAATLLKFNWIKGAKRAKASQQMTEAARNSLAIYHRKNNFVSVIQSFLSFRRTSQQQRQQLSKLFFEIDKDDSGLIQIQQLLQFYRKNLPDIAEAQINQIISNVDKNNSGKIDFNQFITVMAARNWLLAQSALKQAFDFIDVDSTGSISKAELKTLLKQSNKQQIQDLFNGLDANADNSVSFQQFKKYLAEH